MIKPCPISSRLKASPTEFSIWLHVRIAVRVAGVAIEGVEIWSPTYDIAVWAVDESHSAKHRCALANGSSFAKDDVLNHCLDGTEMFRRGDVLDRLILAQSLDPLPAPDKKVSFLEAAWR
jgi:hypothetical protein